MNLRGQTIVADWTWTGQRFERDVAVEVDAEGRVAWPSRPSDARAGRPSHEALRLENRALLPGFVYAHSHAFQRALRNRPERFDTGGGSFWTWRDTMYQLVDELNPEIFYETSRQCFREMLLAGVTSVGEFHYLHHASERDWAFDQAILAGARDAGIRICLIQCYYVTGGVNRPLAGAQKRFDGISVDAFLSQFERLRSELDESTQTLALACHSVRAAPIEDIVQIHRRSVELGVPFHIHVEEQRQEIRDCIDAYGVGPLRLLLDRLPIDRHFTAIHCTHSSPQDLGDLATRGGRVCLCPGTEGNLADGLPALREMRDSLIPICIGSDCNLRLCMTEDLRWLEFVHRLTGESSGVVVDAGGLVAPALFELATVNGAGSLGMSGGSITARAPADLVTIDLSHPSLRGAANEEAILHSIIFGSGNEPIDQVWVSGNSMR